MGNSVGLPPVPRPRDGAAVGCPPMTLFVEAWAPERIIPDPDATDDPWRSGGRGASTAVSLLTAAAIFGAVGSGGASEGSERSDGTVQRPAAPLPTVRPVSHMS